jgi:hypothetical protein
MNQPTPFVISLKPLAIKRRRLDVSQRQLAEWIGGMTGGCISNYEVGCRPVPLSFVVAAAVSLGVPMLDLFEVLNVKGTAVRKDQPQGRQPTQERASATTTPIPVHRRREQRRRDRHQHRRSTRVNLKLTLIDDNHVVIRIPDVGETYDAHAQKIYREAVVDRDELLNAVQAVLGVTVSSPKTNKEH